MLLVFSSIDHQGRYAYDNQPRAALWNLTRLAETLLPLLEQEEGSAEAGLASAKEALAAFDPQFKTARHAGLCRKLGLLTQRESDAILCEDLIERMAANRADFTLTFRRLCDAAEDPGNDGLVRMLFKDQNDYDVWAAGWHCRLQEETSSRAVCAAVMRTVNPAFIPRNHMVEAMIAAAVERQDFQPFEQLLRVGSRPYEDGPDFARYAMPARPEECVTQTFCGT